MAGKYVISFDQGTTSTRAILFNDKGGIEYISQKELTQHYPKSGWVEHDPFEIFEDQKKAFRDVMASSKVNPEDIAAIGITNQRETTVVWDKETGDPVYNAIVWLDKRTTAICDDLREKEHFEYINKATGLVIDSYFSGTKLKWILDNVEGAREKANAGELMFGTIDSWLIYKFSTEQNHVTDHTNASRTMLYNIRELKWDDTILNILDIPKNMLPKVQASSSHFGTVLYDGHEIPILGVAGDQQASLFGQGGYQSGVAKNTYGTGCFMLLNTGKNCFQSKNGLLTTLTASIDGEPVKYALEGSIFIGGASIQWLRDGLKIIDSAKETEDICKSIPSLEDLYVVPAFAGLGAPYWDGNAKGSIHGLTLDVGRKEIVKATIEALAFQTKDVLNAMVEDSGKQMKELKVDGGACINNYLMQFQADILDVPVDRPKMLEVTALGAAFLAGLKAGVWKLEDIEKVRQVDTKFKPSMKPFDRSKKYSGWLDAVERTRSDLNASKQEKPIKFSILDRKRHLKRIKKTTFDVLIIGGGVTGSGIALDAASRGLSVCVIDKNDWASGTSNKSTKLIHGGLRYLKQMEIGLVKESGSERAIVHKLAPHLVVPEKMLLPLVEGGTYGKIMTSIGLKIYDFLADVEGDDKRKMLTKEETLKREPLLDKELVLGGGYYAEYRTDDARLTVEVLKNASKFGAICINYCELESLVYDDNGKIKAAKCLDHNTGKSLKISARSYVSAAGPWVDNIRKKDNSLNKKRLRLTKGVHLVFPREKLPVKQSVYFDVPDGRMIFAIPRGRVTYVGTTDTNYDASLDRVVALKQDAEYLLEAINNTFPEINLGMDDIESNWAGLRPLIHEEGKDPSELSRKDETFVSDSGLISIAGGKLTGYRKMAHRVMERVLDQMPDKRRKTLTKSKTDHLLLVKPPLNNSFEVKDYQKEVLEKLRTLGIDDHYMAWYLVSHYGKQTETILNKVNYFNDADVQKRLLRAELWFSIQYEMTNSVTDFFVRRTSRLYFNIASIMVYSETVIEDCANYLNWNEARIEKERAAMGILVKDATTYYDEEIS
ncbi:MAG: glycerol kinase GlpK [Flavobacteriaceae bacterium]|nr:glycerol kinase GlpK [Bacteroidia bacterium]NNL60664.1 glycerol kinase GlpK [Flavobacteriaceae bacterium]